MHSKSTERSVFRRVQPARCARNHVGKCSPSGECAQFHKHAARSGRISRRKMPELTSSLGEAWPEHMATHVFSTRERTTPHRERHVIGEASMACTLPPIKSASCCVTSKRPSKGISGTARREQRIVERTPIGHRQRRRIFQFEASDDQKRRGESGCAPGNMPPRELSAGQPGQSHANHALDQTRTPRPP